MNTEEALKWAYESDWGTDWTKDCQAMVALAEESQRLLQSALASQREADKLMDKLHAAELELAAIRGEPDALRKVDLI